MYNRYILQPDGSHRRTSIQDAPPPPEKPGTPPCPPPPPPNKLPELQPQLGKFLRGLLPRQFDAGDLMVILILLLIASDCEDQRSNALLTLALYLCM